MDDLNHSNNQHINSNIFEQNNSNNIQHLNTYKKENTLLKNDSDSQENCYVYVFHVNIEFLYNLFISPEFLTDVFFGKSRISSMKYNTNLADEGNEIEIETSGNHNKFKIKVINVINTPFYKSFTHDIIDKPALFAGFTSTFSFYWDSIEQVSILQIYIIIKDNLYKLSINDHMFSHQNKKYKIINDYLECKYKDLEQAESISINKNISQVWNFLIDYNNIKYFFYDVGNNNISIGMLYDKDNEIEIIDRDKNNKIRVLISLNNNEENENEKEMLLQIISSIIPIPKQKIIIKLIKVDEFSCIIIYCHQIMQFLDCDILNSYSFIKKKSLWDIKKLLEN